MAHKLFNHIQGKKGSRWAEFVKETEADHILLVAVDAAKYTHKAVPTSQNHSVINRQAGWSHGNYCQGVCYAVVLITHVVE